MYSIRHLFRIGHEGLSDLVPAVRQAFNDDPTDDRLDQVYGSSPRARIIILSVLGIIAGKLFAGFGPGLELDEYINWPAVAVGLIFAMLIRRYLFAGTDARIGVQEQDFPWLAASLVAPLGLLMVFSFVSQIAADFGSPATADGQPRLFIGTLAVAATQALAVAAALSIAVAALCFSRNWIRGLFNLAVRLLVFRIMVFVTTLVMLEIGFVGPIVAGLLGGIFNLHIPEWLTALMDQLSYAGLMSVIYLAVIGATWTVCRRSFGELLRTGDVDILKTIETLAEDPKRRQKKLEKKHKKEQKKARKRAGRTGN